MRGMTSFVEGWRARMRALRNLRALLSLVWASGPVVVSSGVGCRLVGACLPIAMLTVGKQILDGVQAHTASGILPPAFWWFVALECGLATTASIVGRVSGFFDTLFADRFARHVSVRIMEHASQLDLATYENAAFQ